MPIFFKKKRTYRRCRTLQSYVQGLDDASCDRLAEFLLSDKRNRVNVNRQFLTLTNAAGATVSAIPIVPIATYEAMVLSSSCTRIAGANSTYNPLLDGGGGYDYNSDSWTTYSDSDGSSFTNNNNNNNNNNG